MAWLAKDEDGNVYFYQEYPEWFPATEHAKGHWIIDGGPMIDVEPLKIPNLPCIQVDTPIEVDLVVVVREESEKS